LLRMKEMLKLRLSKKKKKKKFEEQILSNVGK
jgi:hypothetical protein